MKLSFYLILFFLLNQSTALSQKESNNWYFGNSAGLNFATGQPSSIPNGVTHTVEGVATISDKNGNLLFYTDGITVWSRNHQVMQNGFGLNGHPSSTQSAIIVPKPQTDSIYFVFTVAAYGQQAGICYSEININSNAGLGIVVTKNVKLITPVCEKLTAVRHCNNQDIWVLARQYNGKQYYAWKVTATGVSITPISSVTSNHIGNSFYTGSDAIGYMKVSPDGSKIAAVHNYYDFCELGKFDNSTGIVSNVIKISQIPPFSGIANAVKIGTQPYGVEFSSDSKFLYLDMGLRIYLSNNTIIDYDIATTNQYNTAVHDSTQIANSHYFVDSASHVSVNKLNNALQLASTGKIYRTEYPTNKLSCINNPNIQGLGCSFQYNAVTLTYGTSQIGLPNFVTSIFNKRDFNTFGNCSSTTANFQLSNVTNIDSVKWDFGDIPSGSLNFSTLQNPTHIFSTSGTYQVKVFLFMRNSCGNFTDSIVKNFFAGSVSSLNLGHDTTICKNDTMTLRSNILGATYLWSTGATDSLIKVTASGQYWLKVSLNSCTYSDTINIQTFSLPLFTLGNDTLICGNTFLSLAPRPNQSFSKYLWNTNSTSSSITVTTANSYWLHVTDMNGCNYRDTINVDFKQLSNFSLGSDTAICQKDTLILNAAIAGASSYVWNHGQTSPNIKVAQTNIYWCDVTKDGCTYRDSLNLLVKPLPIVQLGNDTTICEGKTYLLDVINPNSSYKWQDNSSSPFYIVSQPGMYKVTVTMIGCQKSDTINVLYQLKPKFSLGDDNYLCSDMSILLDPMITSGATTQQLIYLWQNGSTNKSHIVNTPGLYRLEVSNYCGTAVDEVLIKKGMCESYIPSAFTPNNDGKNDLFKVLYGENVSEFIMQIFNRYGEKIFETRNKDNGWDGFYKNIPQPTGVYVWLIKYKLVNESKVNFRKGTITLIR